MSCIKAIDTETGLVLFDLTFCGNNLSLSCHLRASLFDIIIKHEKTNSYKSFVLLISGQVSMLLHETRTWE